MIDGWLGFWCLMEGAQSFGNVKMGKIPFTQMVDFPKHVN